MSALSARERGALRRLAARVAEAAASPRLATVRRRWRDVNALRRPDRAPVWCRPVGCWPELLPESALVCLDPWARDVERALRRTIVKLEIGDDTPVPPTFPVAHAWRVEPPNVWGVEIGRHSSGIEGGAWSYDPPLTDEGGEEWLATPRWTPDRAATERAIERVEEAIGDILPPALVGESPLHSVLCVYAAELRGLTGLLLDIRANPARVHRLMAYLREAVLAAMDAAEEAGALAPNNDGPMTCSDPLGPPAPDGRARLSNQWVMTNGQEFDAVSPRHWEEFLLAYQRPILARYGAVGYGCCENLTYKLDGVLSLPNLRIVVCSAWTSLDAVIERAGDRCCIMWRQRASDVVFPDDLAVVARDLDEGTRALRGRAYQIVLRELQTLAGHPRRLHEWTRLAIQAAERHAA